MALSYNNFSVVDEYNDRDEARVEFEFVFPQQPQECCVKTILMRISILVETGGK